jgi:hypothetical protein
MLAPSATLRPRLLLFVYGHAYGPARYRAYAAFDTTPRFHDFNGDGKVDVALVDNATMGVTIETGDGAGGFVKAGSAPTGAVGMWRILFGDVYGDGRADLVWLDAAIHVHFGNKDGSLTQVAPSSLPFPVMSPPRRRTSGSPRRRTSTGRARPCSSKTTTDPSTSCGARASDRHNERFEKGHTPASVARGKARPCTVPIAVMERRRAHDGRIGLRR